MKNSLKTDHGHFPGPATVMPPVNVNDLLQAIKMFNHETKIPLSLIKAYLQTVQKFEDHHTERSRQFIAKAILQVDHLTHITNALLSQLGPVGTPGTSGAEWFRMDELLCEAVAEATFLHSEFSFTLMNDKKPFVHADRSRIKQALTNFIENAVKYSAMQRRIEIGCDQASAEVRVFVKDYGSGIPLSLHEAIFEPCFRVPAASNIGIQGCGLGLYIVKQIISSHCGRVGVHSEPGKGATFFFTLPCDAT